ncbi:MAG: stimulus-sensing domain-containing protein [Tistlia sp.]|uniref:sensor histidine kinase n=1 Tax=Tistlia sp. TaxID=3057121 RepID=UPI0034A1A392
MSLDTPAPQTSRSRRARARAQAELDRSAATARGVAERHARSSAAVGHRQRPAWRSPLTRRILILNALVLAIPVLGLLHLDQYRMSLISSELEALRTQADTLASALGTAAVRDGENGRQELMPETARQLLRVGLATTGARARVFGRDGTLVADSSLLAGPLGSVQVVELPPPDRTPEYLVWIEDLYRALRRLVEGAQELPLYIEVPEQTAGSYGEAAAALQGEHASRQRVDSTGRLFLSVAVPVQRYRQVVAALMLTKDGSSVDKAVQDRRRDILLVFGLSFAVTVLLSLYLARTIATPIRRLADAADRVRGTSGRSENIPDWSNRRDEIGDLSGALREMTQALHARMEAIEGFAADVAHEIKNPLTSLRSAVETVARVEDPEQQKKLMSIILDDVQRLDRLISDISDASRLDAELARGKSEEVDLRRLLEALVEVQRAGAEEGGPAYRLELDEREELRVEGIEGRLGQVFRNLIANATSFSPPHGTIRLAARRVRGRGRNDDSIVVTVADEGPGIPPDKLDDVFDRFYSERPKGEKFGTHSGLGLSISRQIVEAHGGVVYAENRPEGGARFTVTLPAS